MLLPLLLALAAPPSLDGHWLFAAAGDSPGGTVRDRLASAWHARAVVAGDAVTVHLLFGSWKPIAGTVAVRGDDIDLTLPETLIGRSGGFVQAAGTLKGRLKRDGDTAAVCLAGWPGDDRPTGFGPASAGKRWLHFVLKRVPPTTRVPDRVTVGPDGQPVAGAEVLPFVSRGVPFDAPPPPTTGPDGTATVFAADHAANFLTVREPAANLIAVERLTPPRLAAGPVRVTLQPAAKIVGRVECPELAAKPGGIGGVVAYLLRGDTRLAIHVSDAAPVYEFTVPPGEYTVNLYSNSLNEVNVPVTVPAGQSVVTVPPTRLTATNLALLADEPAPELPPALGWKNSPPLTLAGLRGKVVVLDFWGWWCGPCVQRMPELFDLHDKYKDNGVVFVGVHLDFGGQAPTVERLDAKLTGTRAKLWAGRDVPFPVALYGNKGSGPADLYGITGYPTTVVIDKTGRVRKAPRVTAAVLDKLLVE